MLHLEGAADELKPKHTMTDNINAMDVILIIAASVFLIGWIAWVIKYLISGRRIKAKNDLLFRRYNQLNEERKKNAMLENLLDSYHLGDDRAEVMDFRRTFRNIENQVRQTKIYKNTKVTNADLAALVNIEKKDFELIAKEACPFDSVPDWLDAIRLSEAMALIRNLSDEDEGNDAKIVEIAAESGFGTRRALTNACKRIIGINLYELMRILRKEKKTA